MDSTGENDSFRSTTSGAYRFLLPLAEGGMGRVDVVVRQDGQFRRLYARKRLHTQYRNDEAFRAMFLDEARIAGLLRHPNAVSVLDVGEDEDGPFLVMDFVDGIPLSTVLKRARERNELLPVQLVVHIVAQAAHGLHAAHELRNYDGTPLSLVHRDVSPQNILVSYNGVVQMTDFGVAKALGRLTKTQSGVLKGKYGYMSPEQLRFHDIDRRSDLFALGVVLFELIAGRRLYGESSIPAPRRILEEPPPDLGEERADLLPALVELTFELLAKDPEARPPTAKNVAERLEAIERDLVLEEGKAELATFMGETFGDLRAATAARIEATIASLSEAPPLARGPISLASIPPKAPHGANPVKPRRVVWLGAAALGIAAVGAGVAFWDQTGRAEELTQPTADPTPSTPSTSGVSPPNESPADSLTPSPSAPSPTPIIAPEVVEEGEAELLQDESAMEDPPIAPTKMRRRRADRPSTRQRPRTTPSMRSVWMWPDNQ